jgi:very-short-patch-repair endonuclease
LSGVEWQILQPDARQTWLTACIQADFETFVPMGTKEAKADRSSDVRTLFKTYSLGVSTNRDDVVYDFDRQKLAKRVEQFIEDYNAEASRWARANRPTDIDSFVDYEKIKWSRNLKRELRNQHYTQFNPKTIIQSLYRPFTRQWLYYADIVIDELGTSGRFFSDAVGESTAICLTDFGSEKPFMVFLTKIIPDLHFVGAGAGTQCFPFYTYDADGSNRRENITDWALAQFQAQYGAEVTKRDIFHYVYAVLHSPQYRERYAENLKRELPRIPLTPALSRREREVKLVSDAPAREAALVRDASAREAALVRDEQVAMDGEQAATDDGSLLPSPGGRRAGDEGEANDIASRHKPPLPPELLRRCRELRRTATGAETLLWQLLRNRQLAGAKFRRQHPLRGYILDFYCHEARLAIELDGGGHAEPSQAAYDAKRTRVLQTEGVRVLRFWNSDVLQRTESVLEAIWEALTPTRSQGEREPEPALTTSAPANIDQPLLPSPGGRGAGGEGDPTFWRFVEIGARLADLHLNYEQAKEYPLRWIENKDVPFSWRVIKMQLSKDKTQLKVNESLTLGGHTGGMLCVSPGQSLGVGVGHRPVPGQHRQAQRHHQRPKSRRR